MSKSKESDFLAFVSQRPLAFSMCVPLAVLECVYSTTTWIAII